MYEPWVALTDFLLTLECVWLALLVARRSQPGVLRTQLLGLFASLALTSLLGGIVHGFFPDESSMEYLVLWRATLVTLGVVGVCNWLLSATLLLKEPWRKHAFVLVGVSFLGYLPFVVTGNPAFAIGIVYYAPAALLLLSALLLRYGQTRRRTYLPGILGMVLTFVAAGIQQKGFGLHPQYLDHNTLYHLVQGLGLYFIYRTLVIEVAAS